MDIQNLSYYTNDNKLILENINLSIYSGKIHFIIGESNSGKSILIKCIAGILPYKGVILYNQKKIPKKLSYMDQKINLFESLTVLDTIRFYHHLYTTKKNTREFYTKYLKSFFLHDSIDFTIGNIDNKISDNQKKRLLLACHLLVNRSIILLDEPLIEYDNEINSTVFKTIRQHVKNNNNICIITMQPGCLRYIRHEDNIYVLENKTILENSNFIHDMYYSNSEYGLLYEIKINDDTFEQNIEDEKKTYHIYKKLFHREIMLMIRNKSDIIKRFLMIIIFCLFQSLVLGPMSMIIDKYTRNIFVQLNIFLHLIIIFFTSSMLPIFFIVPFLDSEAIIVNETSHGWYPLEVIHRLKYFLEISRTLFLSLIYTFIISFPIMNINSFYWILNLNIMMIMLMTTIHILNFSLLFKDIKKIIGCIIVYNFFSFSFNMGSLIFFKNKFTGILQYLSILHLHTNAMLMYMDHNHSYSWIINRLNILPNLFTNYYEPVLLSLGYFICLSFFYFIMVWIKK